MSRFIQALLGLGLVISGISVAGATAGDTDREKELVAEIEKLRTRVEILEQKLSRLETRPETPVEPRAPLTFQWAPSMPPGAAPPLNLPSPNRLPDGTVEREFNGMKYYIMPIANGSTLRPTATVLASPKR